MSCCRHGSHRHLLWGHQIDYGGGRNHRSVLVEEFVQNPVALGHHVILPRLLCFLAALAESFGGIEAIHVSLPHGMKAMDLLKLTMSQRAIVGFDLRNGSLQDPLLGSSIGPGLRSKKLIQFRHSNGPSNSPGVIPHRVEEWADLVDLTRFDHPVHPVGEEGIQDGQSNVDPEEATLELQAKRRVVLDEGFDVGIGAAGDDGEAISVDDGVNGGGGVAGEVVGGEVGVWIGDAEEVVGDAAAFLFGDLVGGDVEALVDLHFVGVDDLGGREAGGEVDGELGLAGAGGAHYDHHLVLAVVVEERVHGEAPLEIH